MRIKKIISSAFLLLCSLVWAQNDSIVKLREVVVSDARLWTNTQALSKQKLNDSVIALQPASLTQLLQFNTLISFKQNGYGMVSSPTFRGTTAQQTAVIWNGININSQFNGQTDFNTINSWNFDQVVIQAGGGSVAYGSSAIGGSVHLNNELFFKQHFKQNLQLNYGSFAASGLNYKLSTGDKNWSVGGSVSMNRSDNDYPLLGTSGLKNQNGQFQNLSLNAQLGYQFNSHHSIQFYTQTYDGQRHFTGPVGSSPKSMYRDLNQRSLLSWYYEKARFKSRFKGAFLSEQYQYYFDFRLPNVQSSRAQTFLAQSELSYQISKKVELQSVVSFTETQANGANIGSSKRPIGTGTLLTKINWSAQFSTEASIRQEQTSAYKSPFLFSVGAVYQPFKSYVIRSNASRNFRMPTFNDLFWQPGGNPNLKAEESFQVELGQEFSFKKMQFNLTAYHNQMQDLIQWQPINGSIWSPMNVASVKVYGIESSLKNRFVFKKHQIELQANYGYTVSEDQKRKLQLTYVPMHKLTTGLAYAYKGFRCFGQLVYSGKVYTLADHNAALTHYAVANAGVFYQFKSIVEGGFGVQIQNITNELYQSVPGCPMPGRNYQIQLNLKL
ncbi:MAG: TonB-dependent receptor [Bacteroidetes bacterium]|nr:TonB-dependent receptor [Bacteroidota bacterium]